MVWITTGFISWRTKHDRISGNLIEPFQNTPYHFVVMKSLQQKAAKDKLAVAFKVAARENFVLPIMKDQAYLDQPLPINEFQTISQPSTVYMMLEWLDPKPGDRTLDVGSGSGWTTALLAHLVGQKGRVYAVERIPELVEFGHDNCVRLGVKNAEFYEAGENLGLTQYAPYDRILVSASAPSLPESLVEQLKIGGKLVIPVKNDILEITRTSVDGHMTIKHPGFVFVPLF